MRSRPSWGGRLAERGLDFADAGAVFEGVHIDIEDVRSNYREQRFITAGFLKDRMVVVVWTPRNSARRIISMRKANDREKAEYSERLGRS